MSGWRIHGWKLAGLGRCGFWSREWGVGLVLGECCGYLGDMELRASPPSQSTCTGASNSIGSRWASTSVNISHALPHTSSPNTRNTMKSPSVLNRDTLRQTPTPITKPETGKTPKQPSAWSYFSHFQ
ncbi:hypothetical protein CC86DRAFT_371539 [Ophiobolus disseminans]|uniref:Uncharacterized protein n=1 Tax=Ophiobolus disseminans TaxID=1469910 RepID=A0A6A6ZUY8_9PLEO|nr:hypothetical protein CC86DRAFT_371539 [Ophiobolus disseminans]